MFTFLCRFFHLCHRKPAWIVGFSLLISAAALFYSLKLPLNWSLRDLYSKDSKSVQVLQQVEQKFGGLGHLSIVIHSPDSSKNDQVLDFFRRKLRTHPDINILEYKTEAEFYRKHKLLYITLSDLKEIQRRVETQFWLSKKKSNPILINLLSDEEKEKSQEENIRFDDLEQKYFGRLQENLGSPDGQIRVLRIYPRFEMGNIAHCRRFFEDVKIVQHELNDSMANPPEIQYSGELVQRIQNEGRLFSQIVNAGKISVTVIVILLLLFFFRIPSGVLLVIIPAGMAVLWTLAATYFMVGHLNLISAALGFVLVGIGLDAAIHLLTRYREERLKRLSAEVAFETIILETGPAISTSLLVSAAAFFTLTLSPFPGLAQFGLMAGIGILCSLIATLLVFPCILILVEPMGLIPVYGKRLYNREMGSDKAYSHWRSSLALIVVITLGVGFTGPQTRFEFNLEKLGFNNQNYRADSLLQASGEAITLPAIIIADNENQAQRIADQLRRIRAVDSLSPTIADVMCLSDLLPADQEEKLKIINYLKATITEDLANRAVEPWKSNLQKLRAAWNEQVLSVTDLPSNYRRKFLGRDSSSGNFVFVFPAVDLDHGLDMLAFAEDVGKVTLPNGKTFYATNESMVQADLLSQVVPTVQRAVLWILLLISILVFLDVRSLPGTLLILMPLLLSLFWTLGFMKLMGIRLNHYNVIALPAVIGLGIENSIHLYHRYLEDGFGSLSHVIRRSGPPIVMANLAAMGGFIGFAFSNHRGLASLGLITCMALAFSVIATGLSVPTVIGWMERRKKS